MSDKMGSNKTIASNEKRKIGDFFTDAEVLVSDTDKKNIWSKAYIYRLTDKKIVSYLTRVLEKKTFVSFEKDISFIFNEKEMAFLKDKIYCLDEILNVNAATKQIHEILSDFELKDKTVDHSANYVKVICSTNYNKEDDGTYTLYTCVDGTEHDKIQLTQLKFKGQNSEEYCTIM